MTEDRTAEVLHAYAEAWRAGDLAGLLGAYADDVVFHYFGTHEHAGDHVGKEAAVAAMIAVSSKATRTLLRIDDVLVGSSGRGAILATERVERDGDSAELDRVLLYRVAGDKIAECWVLDQDQRLVDQLLA